MALKPGEDIGLETHDDIDQFIRVEGGKGKAVLDGTEHNVPNTSSTEPLKLYTLYTPPEHPDGTIHKTKAEAEAYEKEHHK